MYFDMRLFGMTRRVRGRIALAALIGMIALLVAIWQLTLTGVVLARVFEGGAIGSLTR